MTTTTTTTTEGFTGSQATARLREKTGKAQITFLSLAMMAKMKGKTNKAIRNDLGDACPTWISKIFTMADKVMAHIVPAAQDEIGRTTVASAEAHVVAFIEGHMTALGVGTAFEKYGKICHFIAECEASKAVLNPRKEEPAAPEGDAPKEEDAPKEDAPNTAIDEPIKGVDAILAMARTLNPEELADLQNRLQLLAMEHNATIAAAAEAERSRLNGASTAMDQPTDAEAKAKAKLEMKIAA